MATVHPRRQRQAPCANTHNPMQVAEASSAILLLGGQGSAHRPAVAQHGDSGGRRRTVRVGGELAAVLLLVCCLSSAAALKCKSNNGNQIDALPTNVTDTYECDDRDLTGVLCAERTKLLQPELAAVCWRAFRSGLPPEKVLPQPCNVVHVRPKNSHMLPSAQAHGGTLCALSRMAMPTSRYAA
eukprot:481687-Rhodomonas_salina.3